MAHQRLAACATSSADIVIHETIVVWVRKLFKKHPFKAVENIDDNLRVFLDRLKECKRHINDNYDVNGLCHDSVKQLQKLWSMKGAKMET